VTFKSKAQIAHFEKLVKSGQMKKSVFDEKLRATPSPENLPERLGEKKSPLVDPKRLGGRFK
jgi:hypothetical protein